MARSIEQLAELVLKRFYGGSIQTAEQKITNRQIQIHLLQARDAIVRDKLEKKTRNPANIDEVFFTRFESHPVKWSDTREMNFLELPEGYMSLPNNIGLRIRPMIGILNPFIPLPSGWMESRREYAWLENNIGWEVSPATKDGFRIVEFPVMRRDEYGTVMLEVITEQGGTGEKALKMPPSYEEEVLRRVLDILGHSPKSDDANDNVDQS